MAQEFPPHPLKYQLKSSTKDRHYNPKEEGIKLKSKEPHLLWTLLWMMSWKKIWTTDFWMDYQMQTFRSQVGKPSVLKLCKIVSLCLWHVGWFSVWYWWETDLSNRLVTCVKLKKKKKVFLEMLDLRTLIRKLLNSFQGDLNTCISSFSLLFFLSLPRTDEPGGLWAAKSQTRLSRWAHTHAMSCWEFILRIWLCWQPHGKQL